MKLAVQITATIVLLIAGVFAVRLADRMRPKPKEREARVAAPLVRTTRVVAASGHYVVHSQGTVTPRTASRIIPEVSGRVVRIASCFEPGSFFAAGDTLLEIERIDYELAVARIEARVAAAEVALVQQAAEAETALAAWRQEHRDRPAPDLVARRPQLREARAQLDAAKAERARARLDLERTRIVAPYAGRVRSKTVDVGEVVQRGIPIGTIYAVDAAEIRLPLPDAELEFLDLPLGSSPSVARRPVVTLRTRFAGQPLSWTGHIVRTEAEIDPRTRMVHVVARVVDPYGRKLQGTVIPLAVGMFVQAEIQGRPIDNVVRIPRAVLIDGKLVLAVIDGRLRPRHVAIARFDGDDAWIRTGLAPGDQVCITHVPGWTDGLRVRVASTDRNGVQLPVPSRR